MEKIQGEKTAHTTRTEAQGLKIRKKEPALKIMVRI